MVTGRKAVKERRPEIDETTWLWLLDQNPRMRATDGEFSFDIFILEGEYLNHLGSPEDKLRRLYEDVKADLLDAYVSQSPGKRPQIWWRYTAPRQASGRFPGCWYDGRLEEPRLQIGGAGCVAWERMNYCPSYALGLPNHWLDYDVNDPPRFESQASYLHRYGLFLPGEAERLSDGDFQPEVLGEEVAVS